MLPCVTTSPPPFPGNSRETAKNGFTGNPDEDGYAEEDVYPADGPLQSATESLKRIKAQSAASRPSSANVKDGIVGGRG